MADRAGLRHLLLFLSAASFCCPASSGGSVSTSQEHVQVDENQPVTLSCYFSGFYSPRVEWKFVKGSTTSLVCFDNKITASYQDRVDFSQTGITFRTVTRKDTGTYTCMVTDGTNYGEIAVQLTVLVPPSKPTVNVPSSATIGHRVILTCSETDGSPPPEYQWYKDGVPMPQDPKKNRAFSNSSYTMNSKTGELVFDPLTASDSGEYSCQVHNGVGMAMRSEAMRLEAAELNVGGIVAAVLVTLILLGLLVFGVWFAYNRGYFNRTNKGSTPKKVIYSQPSARSDGEFRQTSSFLV
ncbi:junctional adhesion molecule A [Gracilinanus agilis]|uniref:junctional adhesion molecule A n=1 Tax=Gracilinanus agilis TaxID=191870 RepID=UPI001CFDD5B8|nr:junctional adhesion molecule A [Gracilinanus agilis]